MDISLLLEESSITGFNLINHLSKKHLVNVISSYENFNFNEVFNNSEYIIIGSRGKRDYQDPINYLIENSLVTGVIAKLTYEEELTSKLVYISSLTEINHGKIRQETATWINDFKLEYYRFLNTIRLNTINKLCFENKVKKFTSDYFKFSSPPVDYKILDLCLSESFVLDTYKSVIVRIPVLYGSISSEESEISAIIDARLLGHELKVINKVRDYIHVNDFTESVEDILLHAFKEDKKIISLSSGYLVSTKEIVDYIDRMLFTGYGAIDVNQLNDDDQNDLKFDFAHFLTDQYYFKRPMMGLEDGIKKMIVEQQSSKLYNMKLNRELDSFIGKDEELIRIMNGGGSSSHLMLLKSIKKDKKFVRKVALREGVEGNGIPKLKSEIAFINSLSDKNSNLTHRYPQILRIAKFSDAVFYDMDYFNNGDNLIDSLGNGLTVENFYILVKDLFEDILPNNYLLDCRELGETESKEMLESFILNRAKARAKNLFVNNKNVYTEMLQRSTITINGKVYRNPLSIINEIEKDNQLKEIFKPRFGCRCVHGDLTFLNMILESPKNVIMIDPRGSDKEIDILYDFGKMKFSLSGFSEIIKGNYMLEISEIDGIYIRLNNQNKINEKTRQINGGFLSFLQELECFGKMRELEPFWKERILLYEAVNYLADIPFRLHTDSTPFNSIVCYLYGTIYLNDIYESIRSLDLYKQMDSFEAIK